MAYEDEQTPRRLGRYELVRRIAVGGMAEIYLARSAGLEGFEKLVVLKKILPQYATTPDFVSMFLDEARLVAGLSHPNIAQVYDIGLDDEGSYFFCMEFVDGEDVRQIIRASAKKGKPQLLPELAIAITIGIAAGLHAAHERRGDGGKLVGIVHRDVSPSNVLVTYDGCVKLIDFGIAKSEGRRSVTRTGVLKGKSAYMSPEQTQGGSLDRRSDVFAIGILLYELTCGRRPFRGENEYATMRDIVSKTPERPCTLVKGYPKELEAIVLKALDKDPDKRFATALALQVALEKFAREQQMLVSSVALAESMQGLFAEKLALPPALEPGQSAQLSRVLRSLTQAEREAAGAREPLVDHEPSKRPATVTLPGVGAAGGSGANAMPAAPSAPASATPAPTSPARLFSSAPLNLTSVSLQMPRAASLFSVTDELTDTPTVLIQRRPLEPALASKPTRRGGVGRVILATAALGVLIVAGAAFAGYRSSATPAATVEGARPATPVAAPAPRRFNATESGALPAPRPPVNIVHGALPAGSSPAAEDPASVAEPVKAVARTAKAKPRARAVDAAAESPEDREAAARALLGGRAAEVEAEEEPADARPVAARPAVEKPAAEKPAVEKPAAEKPAVEKPAVEKPAAEKPAVEKPAAEKPAVEKPAVEKPAVEKPAVEKPAVEKPAVEKPAVEKPAARAPAPVGTPSTAPASRSAGAPDASAPDARDAE